MRITKGGLILLEKIVRSCIPSPLNGGAKSREFFAELAKKGEDIDFDELLAKIVIKNGLPTSLYNVYEHIQNVATDERREAISEDFIAMFFGGNPHIERALQEIEEGDLFRVCNEAFVKKTFISHILLPIRVTGVDGHFISASYENEDIQVLIKNLIPLPEEKDRIQKGSHILAHYASIVAGKPNPLLIQKLLETQSRHVQFMEICRSITQEGIDIKKTMHFSWAKRVAGIE